MNLFKLSPKAAARRLTKERTDEKRAYNVMLNLVMACGMGERGTLELIHALSMYMAAVIRAGAAEDPGLSRQLLAWMYTDVKKGVFLKNRTVRKKKRA